MLPGRFAMGEDLDRADHQGRWQAVTDRFAANAERLSRRLAVETRDTCLTYGELAARVERFAARIAPRLLDGNRLVGVCLDRDVNLPAWLLAVLRVGGAYLPLDNVLPAARLSQVLEDAEPALIIASRANLVALPPTTIPVLTAEYDDSIDLPAADHFSIRPDTLAYVIYTSGSTGRPKGVEIEHGSLAALMAAMAHSPGLAEGQRMLGLTRIGFDLSVPDMFLPFTVGASLALVDLDTAADPERLATAFVAHRPHVVQGTPSTWRGLLEWGWAGSPGLRLLAGGEALTRELADRLLPRCGELWNIYGPTETTVWSTACRVAAGAGPVPIGWPMDGMPTFVVDDKLRPVTNGATGEIVIGGTGVARGYRNRPELTRDRFVRLADGTRVYRTGDLGRFDEEGALFCLGRSDDQVKVRGFRIELGDVEAALGRHPQVAWCAARLWIDPAGEPTLVGYVVPRPGANLLPGEIKALLAAEIPPYMVPDRIVMVAVMPLTPNGKVDRAALPSPFSAPVPSATQGNRPIIDELADIWCELLGVERVSRADDFFDLGGYSLMTVRLRRRIKASFGVPLALVDLMRCSTLETMAERIAADDLPDQSAMLLNAGGHRPPLYWLDAGPLTRTIMRELPAGQPALALNLSGEDEAELEAVQLRIEDVAARLRQQLIALQPVGPYRLGGWCRWGIVAYELARQLRCEGHDVATLILLDADRPGEQRSGPTALLRRMAHRLRPAKAAVDAPSLSERVELAITSYKAEPYDGDMLLIRPQAALGAGGWKRLLGGKLTIAFTAGDHETMVRPPHSREVASAIGLELARTDGGAASPRRRESGVPLTASAVLPA